MIQIKYYRKYLEKNKLSSLNKNISMNIKKYRKKQFFKNRVITLCRIKILTSPGVASSMKYGKQYIKFI